MKLGVEFPKEWKEKSEKDQILLSDLLYGYVVEDLMARLSKSAFKEYLWLASEDALGEEAYQKTSKGRLEFLYVQSEKKIYHSGVVAGQAYSNEIVETFLEEMFFDASEKEVTWEVKVRESSNGADILLMAKYMEMTVPITVRIEAFHLTTEHPKKKELQCLFSKKQIEFLSYSKEGSLSEALFEIMRKLELISNMESYDIANEIIKAQSISGRHILEDFKSMGEREPKVVSMKRLEQLKSYKNYGYMKKKWQQYARIHKEQAEDWEIVMDRILSFMSPLWKALCENEIFFDDWMPELGRFLG